ncbi:Glycosyl hydrolase family 92 [Rubripirellula obstinata]|uniref:Glycosyl hydrolase family 92 n=1 Tax=Rubripirellula obstinata TaxID=406547 RepID=A0A5B1CGE0_9BACT|nr:GH92 family glycosyl hydrolase [Rubripirellula obstinata]KAA1260257.1 Glycosyl hydrolase family 92 [Rubripirellula obstinata]
MKILYSISLLLFTLSSLWVSPCEAVESVAVNSQTTRDSQTTRVSQVNPFIGTGGHGHTFPGATTPYGMVQLSPDTRTEGWDACGGYHYSDSSILGFSHTHLSGTGIGDLGDVLFMPFVGDAQTTAGSVEDPDSGYRSRFSHDDEDAEPGYYRVHLNDDDIEAELTATPRAGFHRYTFPENAAPSLVIDLAHTIHGHRNPVTELRVINDREIEGYKRTRGWASNHHVYFHAKFDRPFKCELFENGKAMPGHWSVASGNTQAVLRFDSSDQTTVMAKVGISAVDYAGARKNVETEIAGWDFNGVQRSASESWEQQLSKISVGGGTLDDQTIFYTALYHTSISPNVFTDCDGRYRGMDQRIHQSTDGPMYTVFSLWDTFRAFHPLITIIDPERDEEFIRTLLTQYDQGGMLPKWELAGNYTGTMIGYHAIPVIVDAYQKGINRFDVEKAYEAIIKSAHACPDDFLFPSEVVREKLNPKAKHYNDTLGFVPCDLENESVSKALEYAYNDWCIAELAEALGKTDDATKYRQQAKRYQQYYDSKTGFMRGLNQDKSWKSPFNPKFSQHRKDEYTEGNAWQWTWFVPHDVPGLVDLMGGKTAFQTKLDALFNEDSSVDGEESSVDISGLIGQYAHGNEPSHHITHMYNHVGQPWKTQKLVDEILTTLYFNDPNGLSGNEDCGQMSAWYILNAMGFYSFCPGDPTYSIGRPMFDKVKIDLADGKKFTVLAVNNNADNKYIQSAKLNGSTLKSPFFTHQQLMQGGTLELEMGPEPNQNAFDD